jgi:transcriptional regulator with XRE-family HTH domain
VTPSAERMREIMKLHGLTYKTVAEMLSVSVATVTSWTRPETNNAHKPMPANLLELLEYKTGEKK